MAEVKYDRIKRPSEADKILKNDDIRTMDVKIKKKSAFTKFMESIIPEARGNIGDFILYDLAAPYLRDFIRNMIVRSTDMVFYGTSGAPKDSRRTDYTSYGNPSYRREERRRQEPRRRSSSGVEDIIFSSRRDAEDVLDYLRDLIARDGYVRVRDVYDNDWIHLAGNGYTDNNFGWYDLRDAHARPCEDGWYLSMPRLVELN